MNSNTAVPLLHAYAWVRPVHAVEFSHVHPGHHFLADGIPLLFLGIGEAIDASQKSVPIHVWVWNAIELVGSKEEEEKLSEFFLGELSFVEQIKEFVAESHFTYPL